MPDVKCLYNEGLVGIITLSDDILPEETEYPFMPVRSPFHLQLAQELSAGNNVVISIANETQLIRMEVSALTSRTVRLKPISKANNG